MSLNESHREDLIQEATGLVRRARLTPSQLADELIVGFDRRGHLRVFFDADPVFQFDESGALRRAYIAETLYRTQGETLAELKRVRTVNRTELRRKDLDENELSDVLVKMSERLRRLITMMEADEVRIEELIPHNDTGFRYDLSMKILKAIEKAQDRNLAPRVRGKR